MGGRTRYSGWAIALHWTIALAIAFNLGLGWRTETLPRGPELFTVFQLHKSIGITILLLSLWRLWLRLRTPRPPSVIDAGWAKALSSAVHWAFYAIMIVVPFSGWVLVSTSKIKLPTLLFGVVPWPHLPVSGEALHELAERVHGALTLALIPLLALHLIGALRHQFVVKDALVERMVPVRRAGILTVILLIGSVVGAMAAGRRAPLFASQTPAPAATSVAQPAATVPEKAAEPVAVEKEDEAKTEDEKADATGPVPRWTVAPGGRVGFSVSVNGERVSGRFDRWNAAIVFDPERLGESSISAEIDLASVASGDGERDAMLAGDEFFAIAANPKARFSARDIRPLGGNRYEARGTLSMKGKSQALRLRFTLDIDGDTARASGSATIDRRRFGVGTGQFEDTGTIAADTAITVKFSARRQK